MARMKGTGVSANPSGRGKPTPAKGARITVGGKPVTPAVAKARRGPAAAQGRGSGK